MNDITITQFCGQFDACPEGRRWAFSLGLTNMSELWTRTDLKPEWRIWIFSRGGVASERDQRLFAVWCARRVQHLMQDPRSIAALDVAERYANGEATREELEAASAAACAAANDAWAAAWGASAAARSAASVAAWGASAAARSAAARSAAAIAAEGAVQNAELLRRYPQIFINLDSETK
jgi:hypothetical protein